MCVSGWVVRLINGKKKGNGGPRNLQPTKKFSFFVVVVVVVVVVLLLIPPINDERDGDSVRVREREREREQVLSFGATGQSDRRTETKPGKTR